MEILGYCFTDVRMNHRHAAWLLSDVWSGLPCFHKILKQMSEGGSLSDRHRLNDTPGAKYAWIARSGFYRTYMCEWVRMSVCSAKTRSGWSSPGEWRRRLTFAWKISCWLRSKSLRSERMQAKWLRVCVSNVTKVGTKEGRKGKREGKRRSNKYYNKKISKKV